MGVPPLTIAFTLSPFKRSLSLFLFLISHIIMLCLFMSLLLLLSYFLIFSSLYYFPYSFPPHKRRLIPSLFAPTIAHNSQPQLQAVLPFHSTHTPLPVRLSYILLRLFPPFSPSQHSSLDTVLPLSRTYISSHIFPHSCFPTPLVNPTSTI